MRGRAFTSLIAASSAINRSATLASNTNFAATVEHAEGNLGRLIGARIDQCQIRQMHSSFAFHDTAGLAHALRLGVDFRHSHALHHSTILFRDHAQHFTAGTFRSTGNHQYLVAFFNTCSHDYSTSGARLMIFMNFLARSSRTTGPKIRVPIGSICLLSSTAALRSKRMALPSARRTGNAVRTTTAWCTSPFFTLPRGIASLTDTTITSPTEAVLRLEPPSTLMHCTRRAPELSATSRLDSTIIISQRSLTGLLVGQRSAIALRHHPGLALGNRRTFFNADQIA